MSNIILEDKQMRKFKKLLCLLLVGTLLLSGIGTGLTAFAESNSENESPLKVEVTTDKTSYGALGIAKFTVKVTNVSDETIQNISAEAVFGDLAPCKSNSETKKEAQNLSPNESFSFSYSATVSSNKANLNIFQKFFLWIVRLFNGGFTAKNNDFDNGRDYTENTKSIKFGNANVTNTVRVWYNGYMETNDDTLYQYTEDDISYDEEWETYFINNIIIISFDWDCSEERKAEIVKVLNGEVAGSDDGFNELYIRLAKRMTLSELEKLEEKLEELDGIDYAQYDRMMEFGENSTRTITPNDPFRYYDETNKKWDFDNDVDWTKDKTDFENERRIWGQKAIQAPEAWAYNKHFKHIDIGIVDTGFDSKHEDLKIEMLRSDKTNHGTHVAGIIGATTDEIGIAGLTWNSSLYGYSVGNYDVTSRAYTGLRKLVESGCKVINFSLGNNEKELTRLSQMDESKAQKEINKLGENASEKMSKLLTKAFEEGRDFIVVQSAGNGNENGLGVDAKYSGLFSSIMESNCYDKHYNVSKEDILNRIIIVTSSDNGYNVYKSANGGTQVDIAAPGVLIYSTVAGIEEKDGSGAVVIAKNQKYGFMTGTSMAAPFVTGVAGLVWSINSEFSGAEVKEFICKEYSDTIWVKDNDLSPTTGDFKMLNAKLAVEEALREVGVEIPEETPPGDNKFGELGGEVQDNDTKHPLVNVTVKAYNEENVEVAQTITSESGWFLFSQLPVGKYTFKYSLDGYYQAENGMVIGEGINLWLNPIYLKKIENVEPPTGDDGVTNWDFIEPVTHQKTVPEGYTGIYTAEDLYNVRNDLYNAWNDLTGNYILMNDIDLSSWGSWEPIGDETSYVPISISNIIEYDIAKSKYGTIYFYSNNSGYSSSSRYSDTTDYYIIPGFYGVFDGNGYVIKNMIINIESGETVLAGLFGRNNGVICDMGILGGNVSSYSHSPSYNFYVSSIAGFNFGIISNCYNTSSISYSYASPSSYAITSNFEVGGIAGRNYNSINKCYNTGNVSATSATSSFSSSNFYVGGVAGVSIGNNANISSCYNIGNIFSSIFSSSAAAYSGFTSCAGGIVGQNSSLDSSTNASINNCYNLGNISSSSSASSTAAQYYSYAGGIVGYNYDSISNCYNKSSISSSAYNPSNSYIGGIAGCASNTTFVKICYFLDNISSAIGNNRGNLSDVKSLSESQMKSKANFVGFDFDNVWYIDSNSTYPYPQLRK